MTAPAAPRSQQVLTAREAMKLLRVSKNTFYKAAREGQIPSIRIGRRIFIPRRAFERLLRQGAAVEA